jgi:hypothetical protein
MDRRNFIRMAALTGLGLGLGSRQTLAQLAMLTPVEPVPAEDARLQDYFEKMRNFERPHRDDVFVDQEELPVLHACAQRLGLVEAVMGYGFFHLLSFDDALMCSRNYERVGAFTRPEVAFMEKIFHRDARCYGFLGDKPLQNLTHSVPRNEVVRIAATGNYLHRGASFEAYQKIKKSVGDRVILTSGVRGIMKQFRLFLGKASQNNGNLSLASRQMAPPGYSYHGFNDFDVGQAGFGDLNFTERFTDTDAYRRLVDLGCLNLRYPRDNMLGVRYEPWHIMVTAGA